MELPSNNKPYLIYTYHPFIRDEINKKYIKCKPKYKIYIDFEAKRWIVEKFNDNEECDETATFDEYLAIECINECMQYLQTKERIILNSCKNCFIDYLHGVGISKRWNQRHVSSYIEELRKIAQEWIYNTTEQSDDSALTSSSDDDETY